MFEMFSIISKKHIASHLAFLQILRYNDIPKQSLMWYNCFFLQFSNLSFSFISIWAPRGRHKSSRRQDWWRQTLSRCSANDPRCPGQRNEYKCKKIHLYSFKFKWINALYKWRWNLYKFNNELNSLSSQPTFYILYILIHILYTMHFQLKCIYSE